MVRYNTKKSTKTKKSIFLAFFLLVVVLAGIFWWLHRPAAQVKQVKINGGKIANANPNVPGSSTTNTPPSNSIVASKDNEANQPSSGLPANVRPTIPTGDFVSSHYMSFSGKNGPSVGTSTCNTTPGASCQIRFVSGNTTKSLPIQKTNAQGSTSWDSWSLTSIGLTAGTWKIYAIATNGNLSASATDSMQLVVKP